jgi:ketosteroid isomerase-like protein
MSEENVETVKEIFRAWEEKDAAAAMSRIDPNVELDFSTVSFVGDEIPERVASGVDPLSEGVNAWLETWDSVSWLPQKFIDIDEHVIVLLRMRARGRGSGVPVDRTFVATYTVRDGRVVAFRGFDTLAGWASSCADVQRRGYVGLGRSGLRPAPCATGWRARRATSRVPMRLRLLRGRPPVRPTKIR